MTKYEQIMKQAAELEQDALYADSNYTGLMSQVSKLRGKARQLLPTVPREQVKQENSESLDKALDFITKTFGKKK